MYSRRLKVASSMSALELTNTCSMCGSVFSASAPQADGIDGHRAKAGDAHLLALDLAA